MSTERTQFLLGLVVVVLVLFGLSYLVLPKFKPGQPAPSPTPAPVVAPKPSAAATPSWRLSPAPTSKPKSGLPSTGPADLGLLTYLSLSSLILALLIRRLSRGY